MKLALLGAGQLGGSFALALRAAPADGFGAEADVSLTITAYDPITAHAEQLLARGAVDALAVTATDAVRGAEIVVIAAPLGSYRTLAGEIAPALTQGAIVMDMGSVKGGVAPLAALLPMARLVPAHPISGSEKSGPEAARAELFKDRLCILTPDDTTDAQAREIVQTLWHAVGADVIEMPAAVHDQIYAYVSHLPHFIAFVAAEYFHALGVKVLPEDAILQQFLRISRSNARMWADIALANREQLLPVLGTYTALLQHFATELRAGEKVEVADSVAVAKAFLPRILAASLISCVSLHEQQSGTKLRPFGAGGMRDIVAPAAHAPEADMEAISQVAHALADHLDAVIVLFKALEQRIGAEDAAGLLAQIERMVADAHALVEVRN